MEPFITDQEYSNMWIGKILLVKQTWKVEVPVDESQDREN